MRWLNIFLLIKLMLVASVGISFAKSEQFTILDNTDLPGGDYRSFKRTSLERCKNVCLQENRCRAYTYNPKARRCFLKDRVTHQAQFKGVVSGRKQSIAAKLQGICPLAKSTYRSVDKPDFTIDFFDVLKRPHARLMFKGKLFLKANTYVTNGFSTQYLSLDKMAFPELCRNCDSHLSVNLTFVDEELREVSDPDKTPTKGLILQGLGSVLYYQNRELWKKYPLTGDTWRFDDCREP